MMPEVPPAVGVVARAGGRDTGAMGLGRSIVPLQGRTRALSGFCPGCLRKPGWDRAELALVM